MGVEIGAGAGFLTCRDTGVQVRLGSQPYQTRPEPEDLSERWDRDSSGQAQGSFSKH
jgi:hypothetical protein